MAVYNTASDAANTAVRAFLTKIGEFYLGRSFNTGSSGRAKQEWENIRDTIFEKKCAYCGKSDSKLQIDHLFMFNREDFGLHHPGNIVPACSFCNSRSKDDNKKYNSWEKHLSYICEKNNEKEIFLDRWTKIKNHMSNGEYKYPLLSSEENKALRIITNNLYSSVKSEFDKAVKLFEDLDEAFTKK
jgi:hypothetical protein